MVPCAERCDGRHEAGYDGVARTIAVKGAVVSKITMLLLGLRLSMRQHHAGIIIAAATPQSKDLSLHELLQDADLSVVQDVVSIDGMNLTSPIYSGKAMQTVALSGDAAISVRANVFPAAASGPAANVSVSRPIRRCI